ncbi:nuclear transport factor 2 family protein [Roseateles sp.]|jgi:ketosteroid isomerase-like protein|uniref:nuclear transport factor 2 family protein n=1 Tax=Roseateles sp. TaxID=1971397 RepID=UPI0037CA35D8
MKIDQHTAIASRTVRRRLMAAASLAVAAFAVPAQAQDAGKGMTAVQLLKRSLDTFLAKDMKGWADLCDENVVAEFPFSPDPATRKLVGRAAIYAYIKDYPKAIDIKAIPTLKIHATDDPNVAIAEWSVSGRVISNGNPYELSYATVVTFRNGLMVNYREYWNPQAFMAAMAGARF